MRILIVDDHLLFAQSLSRLLADADGLAVVGVCNSGQAALEKLHDEPVDVVVSDWQMPAMSGLTLLTQIRESFPSVKVLILSMITDADTVREAIRAGAVGFVTKNADEHELVRALHQIKYDVYLSSAVLRELTRQPDRSLADPLLPSSILTNREREILKLIAAECTTNEIAHRLFISPHTVEAHRKNLLRKLDVKNSVGLIKFAIRSGLSPD